VAEGPFNEAAIVDMIRSGLAEHGHICPVGASEWVRLGDHPAFGAAIDERRGAKSVAPEAAPTQAAEAQFRAQPQPQGHFQSQAPTPQGQFESPFQAPHAQLQAQPAQAAPRHAQFQAQPGSSPSHYSMPADAPAAGFAPMPSWNPSSYTGAPHAGAGEKSKIGLVLAIVGVAVAVLGAAGVAAYVLLFRAPPPLAQFYPESTEVFVEAPNLKAAALGLARVDLFDRARVDEKKVIEDAQASLARAFDLPPADAARVALGVGAVAFGGHDMDNDHGSIAITIAWNDAKAAETLLASSRFSLEGDAGKGGKRYVIKRRELSAEQKAAAGAVESTLSSFSLNAKDPDDQLVWFPAKKLLVLANARGAADVTELVEGTSKNSLARSAVYAAQKKSVGGDAALIGFVDSKLVENANDAKVVEKYFHGTGPIQLAASFEKSGIRLRATGLLSVPADQLASASGMLAPKMPTLSLANKLPKETFAYVAFSTRMKTGKEAREDLYKNLAKESSTAGMQKTLEEGEHALGVDLVTVFDALGEEAVIAAAARDGFKYDPAGKPSFDDLAIIYRQKVRDLAAAKRLTATLKSKMAGGPFKLQASGDDLVIEGDKMMPRGELRFVGGDLVAVVGSRELADRTFAALAGKSTLGDDRAHVAATEPLEAKHLLFWLDLGRVGETALAGMPKLKEQAQAMGVDVGAIRLAGEHRATGAVALNLALKDDKLAYTIDSINLPIATAMIAALAPESTRSHADLDAKLGGSTTTLGRTDRGARTGTTTTTGATIAGAGADLPPLCLAALDRYERCIYKSVPRSTRPKLIKNLRDTMIKTPPQFRVTSCQSILDSATRASPSCK
jgi:hypothetical protein